MAGSATPFTMRCSGRGFSDNEIRVLRKFGRAFDRLGRGLRQPRTAAQRRFVEVANDRCHAKNFWEKTWRKYLDRLERERDPAVRADGGRVRVATPANAWRSRSRPAGRGVRRKASSRDIVQAPKTPARPVLLPQPVGSGAVCVHGRRRGLCDYCWAATTGGSLR